MEGLYFETKPRRGEQQRLQSSDTLGIGLTSNHRSCPSFSHLSSASPKDQRLVSPRERSASWKPQVNDDRGQEINYKLTLIGSQPVHHLTTMTMLPWVVAEICRSAARDPGAGSPDRRSGGGYLNPATYNKAVWLSVSLSWVRCVSAQGQQHFWDPLTHTVLFECRPHQVTNLMHNSQEPSSFACLVRDTPGRQSCACYVFRCQETTKVPEIIGTLRQASKSSARNNDITPFPSQASGISGASDSSLSTTSSSSATVSAVSPANFAKKFEVLFCGRVSVAHKKAPPALIDECIEKFSQLHSLGKTDKGNSGGLVDGLKRALSFQSNGLGGGAVGNGAEGSFNTGTRPLFKKEPSFPSLHGLDENGLSPEISNANTTDPHTLSTKVQPSNLQENRTMLFTVGRSQIYLVSPDTKKVAIEKSFREISFCSQGIRHVDHFGFICRETVEGGNGHFVCYVFQCTDESLVDEIMLTLKQAFSVAALQQNAKTQSQQCDVCPMQQLHRLCERIEGSADSIGQNPSKTKLELQRHMASLDNEEQAQIFENTMRACPKSDQEENELVMVSLRNLYEEKQKHHQHTVPGEAKQAPEDAAPAAQEAPQQSSSRQRLEQFKTRAKRSLTESLEGIWKGSSKAKSQMDNSEESESSSSICTVSSSQDQPCLDDPLCTPPALRPTSPLSSHNSTGDLKRLDGSPTPLPRSSSPCNAEQQGFRRRASTFSHSPSPSSVHEDFPLQKVIHTGQDPGATTKPKLVRHYSVSTDSPHQSKNVPTNSTLPPLPSCPSSHSPVLHHQSSPSAGARFNKRSPLGGLRARLHSSSSVPNFLKFQFLAPVQENDCPEPKKSDVAALSAPRAASVVGQSPLRSHRHSWRQQIFLRVSTPQKGTDSSELVDPCLEGSRLSVGQMCGGSGDSIMNAVPEEAAKKSKEELRELWRKAILQQILLLRMEKENQKLQASENNLLNKRLKLDYEEITPCLKDVTLVWEKMLGTPGRAKVKFDTETIHAAVAQGVPRQHRGEIWKFLSEQYLLRQTVPARPPSNPTPYKELLKQLTSQQHAILIDLGRTFPSHPYFQAQLGAGQLSLYNILKAYSLLDPEVGYCQGLSFIAGVLLLHMGEEDAFNMLKFLMYDVGLRKQYRPDMIILQIQMYQLSRLLHDYHRDLHGHFEQQEIGPSLYATPWFLTLFASHFPLGFVARVFDMLFLQGPEVIFKVALSLLGSHKPLILQHDSLESIVDFIKTTLPNLGLVQMEKTINQVCEMDVSKQLQAYEVEYHVLQDELLDTPTTLNQQQRAAQLERTNQSLRQQNLDLLEELQVCHARVCNLEGQVEVLAQSESRLKEQVSALEEEKLQLETTATQLQNLLTSLGIHPSSLDGLTLLPPSDTQKGLDVRTADPEHPALPQGS
ncbi:TBC1 domain family member 1 isoform X1 [Oryzias latipes]|uniref:TBC1 domain family member 1 isoform X1 n=1 Tax=Oryzias latipes TaxID=8090 RepID=UPI0005CC76BD|nr:TBC1 domain family member 1 isoform X1 [Oryzias latipes]XP_023812263.1 TBC1 domain family member 1 isoform X1 [Oryzias latipes]